MCQNGSGRAARLRWRYRRLPLVIAFALGGSPLVAQDITRTTPIDDLPRPGYEPRTIQTGGFVIEPRLDLGVRFDNNIFATDENRKSDTIFLVRPSVEVKRDTDKSMFFLRGYGEFSRYAKTSQENTDQFGIRASYRKGFGDRHWVTATASFDRTFDRRGAPEANPDLTQSPALINVTNGDLEYRYDGSRIGVTATAGVTKLDYLSLEDSDRDMLTYRVAVKGQVKLSQRVAVFVQPYLNDREPRLKTDRNGVDRSTTTYGALAGVSLELGDKLNGNIGIGIFHSNPRDLALDAFTGLSANGQLTWRPQTRTAVRLDIFRGDVATIRAGAMGRIDTRIDLGIDQEVRHNLIVRGSVGMRNVHYRESFDADQRYWTGEGGARYLLNRHMWIEAVATYTRRTADIAADEFSKWQGMIRLGLTY